MDSVPVNSDGVPVVKLAATPVVDFPIDLHEAVLDQLRSLHTVLHEVGELQQLAEADHLVTDGNLFNLRVAHTSNNA